MTKNEIRLKYKDLRGMLSSEEVDERSIALTNKLVQMPIWDFSFYHLYLSISEKKEVNTEFLLHVLQGKDKNILVSRTNFSDASLEHVLLTDNLRIQKNKWGIPEPIDGIVMPTAKIEVVFVPLLAFDLNGNRIGYGKGFYDRFLEVCRPEVLKIGLSIFDAEKKLPGIKAFDVPLDYCVTPSKIYDFKSL